MAGKKKRRRDGFQIERAPADELPVDERMAITCDLANEHDDGSEFVDNEPWPLTCARYKPSEPVTGDLLDRMESALASVAGLTELEQQTICKIFLSMRAVGDRDKKKDLAFFYHRAKSAVENFFDKAAYSDEQQSAMASLEWLGMDSETVNALADVYIFSIADIASQCTYEDLLSLDRVGRERAAEVVLIVRQHGYDVRGAENIFPTK